MDEHPQIFDNADIKGSDSENFMSQCSQSDSDPGEDTLNEKEMSAIVPEKILKNLRKNGLVEERPLSSAQGKVNSAN